ncbi:MAG: shikimate kinase [Bacteroidota bacterium]
MSCSFLLIGHRTSGKSVLGRRLAEARGLPFLDLDDVIAQREGRSAEDLVGEDEKRFRQIEREILQKIVADHAPAVIASGGGCEFWPLGIRTIWIFREGWDESALRDRRRLRPQLLPEEEIAWMRETREERYRLAAHLCLHIERGCREEEAARRLVFLAGWLDEAANSAGLKKSWVVPRSADDLPRAEADVQLFGMAGVEIRSDVFSEVPTPNVPWLASLRTEDRTFFQRASGASAFDCDASLLRFLALKGLEPRPLIISTHPDDVFKEFFDFLTGLPDWVKASLPDWHSQLQLKYAPRIKSWIELRYANQLYKVYEKAGNSINFLPQGKKWSWMRVQRLFQGNEINYLSTGCLEHSQRPPSLDYFLPHIIGDHARDFYGIIGNPVEHSIGDIFHRALSLQSENGTQTYVKIQLTQPEIDNCLHLLPQIGFKGLSVTSPLKRDLIDSNFVGTEEEITTGNTLALIKGSFLLFDTDQEGMDAALREIEADGIAPGSVLVFGNGGVVPALTRALDARGWGPLNVIHAREGWGSHANTSVQLVVDASGSNAAHTADAPICAAWLDLRYRNIPPPPAAAERFYNGLTFFKSQALAQRRIWELADCIEHPLL